MEITEAMHKYGLYLFDNPNTSKVRGGTSYEQQRRFIEGFWKKFRKDIINARVNNNLDSLFNLVGKENFDKLNGIINAYSSSPYYKMMDDVINNRSTDLTDKRTSLYNDSINILELMTDHVEQYSDCENLTGKNK
ncbi:MAG: hypothetical protein ACK5HP_05035 [Bacilli bacterium]